MLRRHNQTSMDVSIGRLKTSKKIYNGRRPITGIQMKRKELTKPFMMISN